MFHPGRSGSFTLGWRQTSSQTLPAVDIRRGPLSTIEAITAVRARCETIVHHIVRPIALGSRILAKNEGNEWLSHIFSSLEGFGSLKE